MNMICQIEFLGQQNILRHFFLDPVMGIHFSLPDARKQSSQGVAFRPL